MSRMLRAALCAVALAAVAAGTPSMTHAQADGDKDGLPDGWERRNAALGVAPGQPDLIFIACRVSDGATAVDESVLGPQLEALRIFFGRIGVRLVASIRAVTAAAAGAALYDTCIPSDLRGYAHALRIARGGGGQSGFGDFGVSQADWRVMAHELGHQLGLRHVPPGSAGPSPLYASLMNYDYLESFNGTPAGVQFSRGQFASYRADENRLDEVLPFPASDLAFLTRGPYFLELRRAGSGTEIDWNRNGVLGERGILADINDAYALNTLDGGFQVVGKTSGSPVLASHPNAAPTTQPSFPVLVHPVAADSRGQRAADPSPRLPMRVVAHGYVSSRGGAGRYAEGVTLGNGAVSPVSAVGHAPSSSTDPLLYVAYARLKLGAPGGVVVAVEEREATSPFRTRRELELPAAAPGTPPLPAVQPVLVDGGGELWLLVRHGTQPAISLHRVQLGGSQLAVDSAVRLDVPSMGGAFHAAYDLGGGYLVIAARQPVAGAQPPELRLHYYQFDAARGGWTLFFSDVRPGERTVRTGERRPWVLIDIGQLYGRFSLGDGRRLAGIPLVYYADGSDSVTRTIVARALPRAGHWRTTLVGNDWTLTRSGSTAAFHEKSIMWAVRWAAEDATDNDLVVHFRAGGIERGQIVGDFDDVTEILERGLRRSLETVRSRTAR